MQSAMNLGGFLSKTARLYPERTGLVQGEKSWRWCEIDSRVNALSTALRELGIVKGDRVMVQSPNNHYMFESLYAIAKAGGVYVPINFRLSPEETADIALHCHAKAFMFHPDLIENAKLAHSRSGELECLISMGRIQGGQLDEERGWFDYDRLVIRHLGAPAREVEVQYDDAVWQPYTSGTTGRPRGVVLTHGQMTFVLLNRIADVMPGLNHEHASLVIAPLSHGAGSIAVCNVFRGAKSVLLSTPHFDEEECWRLIQKHRITNMFTVPTILVRLASHPAAEKYDHSSLQYVMYAGAPISRMEQKKALEKFGNVLVQYYGAAEFMGTGTVLTPAMHSLDDNDPDAPVGSCGVVRTGMEITIMDDEGNHKPNGECGEICIRGPAVFRGYFDDPEETAKVFHKGWLRTGDLGYMDDRGFLYLVGRSKEMYISGGFNVFPNEVEHYLLRHPAVKEAAVVSLPDTKWGEVGVAIVTLKDGHVAEEGDIASCLKKELAGYKRPKRIFIFDEIPTTAYGKTPKQLLRDVLHERGLIKKGQDVQ